MIETLNVWWFTTCDGKCIGIVKTKDSITEEIKYRIGTGEGKDEEFDKLNILNCGDKFFPEVIK